MQLIQSQQLTMSSREIAELLEMRHDTVKRSIERLSKPKLNTWGDVTQPAAIQLPPMVEVKNHLGQTVGEYMVCKRDSYVVVAQLSPQFTAKLVDRWQELEAQAAAQQFNIPTTLSGALRLAAEQAETIEAQQLLIEQQKSSVEFVESYVEAEGLMGFRQVAKLLGANERQFKQMLTEKGIMYYLGGYLTPMAQHIKAGRFEVKTGVADNGHPYASAKFTPKGVEYISRLCRSQA